MITRILLALIYVQNSITMPHIVVIQLMRVIKWPRSHSHGSCVNKKGRGFKGFYIMVIDLSLPIHWFIYLRLDQKGISKYMSYLFRSLADMNNQRKDQEVNQFLFGGTY